MSDCIEHTQKGISIGYATAKFGDSYTTLHRRTWCLHHGKTLEDIKGLEVRHLCNNARCINIEHLEIGTPKDNADDKRKAGVQFGAPNYGESNGRSVLTDTDVEDIRRLYVKGSREFGIPALARRFRCGTSQIWRVIKCLQRN